LAFPREVESHGLFTVTDWSLTSQHARDLTFDFRSVTAQHCHIYTWFEEVSVAARAQHAAMKNLLERMCQLEFERAQEAESNELEKNHLLDELQWRESSSA
jgi:hypothetical protein